MGLSSDSSDSETEVKAVAPANGASKSASGLPVDDKRVATAIGDLIKSQGIETLTSSKIRGHLSGLFAEDFTAHKKVVDELTRQEIEKFQQARAAPATSKSEPKADSDDSDSDPGIASRDVPRKKIRKPKSKDDEDEADDGEMDLMTRVKSRRRAATKLPERRPRGPSAKRAKKTGSLNKGYTKLCVLSDDLSNITGLKFMPRHSVVKFMWAYFREHGLMDPKDRRMVLPDEKLKTVFKSRFAAFGMMKVLRNHIFDPEHCTDDVRAEVEEEARRLQSEREKVGDEAEADEEEEKTNGDSDDSD